MKIKLYGNEVIIRSSIVEERIVKLYYCNNGSDVEIIPVNFPLLHDDTFDPDDFQLYFLAKRDVLENEIYQVYDRYLEKRIGWIFPVTALDSAEHEFASNEYFLKYANIAKKKIFANANDDLYTLTPELSNRENIKFGDFFHESTVILIISSATLGGDTFCIQEWLPSLAANGYSRLTRRDPGTLTIIGTKPLDKRLYLKQIAPELRSYNFICFVFTDLIPFERHPLLSFFYYYQIIEIMLTLVFQVEQRRIYTELDYPVSVGDVVKTKDIMDQIGKINSEKARLSILSQKYTHGDLDTDDIKGACNKLLELVQKDTGATALDSIYRIRNFLFHQYHSTSGDVESELANVNSAFLLYLSDLCSVVCIK